MWRHGIKRALRTLRTEPSFFWIATLALAVSVCVGSLAFAIVDAVVLRPLAFRDSDRLVMIWSSKGKIPRLSVSAPDFLAWKTDLVSIEDLAAIQSSTFVLALQGKSVEVQGARVTPNIISVLGSDFVCGSGMLHDGDIHSALISFRLWSTLFNKDSTLCGKTVQLDGIHVVVVGVLPARFHLTYAAQDYDVLMPLARENVSQLGRNERGLRVIGRLKKGASVAQLDGELMVISMNLSRSFPQSNRGLGAWAEPLRYWLLRDSPQIVWTILFLVLLICIIALANITTLFLARTIRIRTELGVRIALGAEPLHLAREAVAEGLVFGILGYIIGLLLLAQMLPLFSHLMPSNILRAKEVAMDWRIVLFGTIFAISGIGLIILPSLLLIFKDTAASSIALVNPASFGNRSHTARLLRSGIMAVQFMLVVVTVTIATLAGNNFFSLLHSRLGFASDHIITAELSPSRSQFPDNQALMQYFDHVLTNLHQVPSVTKVGLTSAFPLSGDDQIVLAGTGSQEQNQGIKVGYRTISSSYFEVMQIPLIRGRLEFDQTERGTRVAVINRLLGDHIWPKQDPIGKELWVQIAPSIIKQMTVVGVVDNVHHTGLLNKDIEDEIYVPYHQDEPGHMFVVARTAGPPGEFLHAFEQEIIRSDNRQRFSLDDPKILGDIIDTFLERPRFYATSLLIMSTATVILALYGVVGTVLYVVQRRSAEIAIRRCMGATFRHIFANLSYAVLASAWLGLMLGTIGCFYLIPWAIAKLQLTINYTTDFQAVISGTLAAVSLIAVYLPLRSTLKSELAQLLRYE